MPKTNVEGTVSRFLRGRMATPACLVGIALFLLLVWSSDTTELRAPAAKSTSAEHTLQDALAASSRSLTPPSIGCEDIVESQRRLLIDVYSGLFQGIKAVNILGFLQTENKGDATIWTAQQLLLNILGIRTMEVCRYYTKYCDTAQWNGMMTKNAGEAAVAIAGGGNFNDYYWDDQIQRPAMVAAMQKHPIRSFPQSIHMTKRASINATVEAYGKHGNLHVGSRDQHSYDWCLGNLEPVGVKCTLTPDIAFMFGSRPDIRLRTRKLYDVLILYRKDAEAVAQYPVPDGISVYHLTDEIDIKVRKVDWNAISVPRISRPGHREDVAHARAMQGFEMLAQASLVITDRLHAHILSTMLGTPHILLDSKLGKNMDYHKTWTRDCDCVRTASDSEEAMGLATLFFKQELRAGRDILGKA